eukprot:TRINITY_DN6438_c0_g1_i1.p1 TRINITY_DN6438_c0_g1~~TRINITY_DN6438_c0_g1_i1.p1  ORF type:complete len:638 (+),score=88.02 TRINITY_DN6438_c0_g1_i1:57-1970(+)
MRHLYALVLMLSCVWGGEGYVTLTQEKDLKVGENAMIFVNSMRSLSEAVPLDFYSLKYPKPKEVFQDPGENLGQLLMGDKLQNSKYVFKVNQNTTCSTSAVKLGENDVGDFIKAINSKYRVHMMYEMMDLLAVHATNDSNVEVHLSSYRKGFLVGGPYGKKDPDTGIQHYYIHNHIAFYISYNTPSGKAEDDSKMVFVVGFRAEAFSSRKECSPDSGAMILPESSFFAPDKKTKTSTTKTTSIPFSYSVTWVHEDRQWSGRFSDYLSHLQNPAVELADNIRESLLMLLLLTAVVAWIMMRTLHLDFNRYNNPDNEEEMREEVGWKLVHTDVFRPPDHPNQLAAFVGTGVQITGMAVSGLFFSLIGFVSPGTHGNILMMMIFIYAILAIANGYVCGTLQMTFGVKQWKTPIAAGLLYPGVVFLLWGITECFLAAKHATSAVGFGVLFNLIAQWWGISLPLIVLGASAAYKRPPIAPPIPYRTIARQIPPQSWVFSTYSIILLPGLVTFVAVFMELQVIMQAIWQGRMYLLFSYIAMLTLLAAAIVAEVTIVVTYYTLIYEDYRWWWKSVICNTGMGIYFFTWCIFYMFTLGLGSLLSHWLFLCFAFIVSLAVIMVCGTIGFYSAWWFVTKIYNAIKIE